MKTTCGVFVIQGNNILIVHPTGAPYDEWSIPKGLCNPDESTMDAAIRETYEETNIDLSQYALNFLGESRYKSRKKKLHAFACFLDPDGSFLCKCNSFLKNGSPEVDMFKWASYTQSFDLIHYTQRQILQERLQDGKISIK